MPFKLAVLVDMVVLQVDLMHEVVFLKHTVGVTGAHLWRIVLFLHAAHTFAFEMGNLKVRIVHPVAVEFQLVCFTVHLQFYLRFK